MKYKPMKSVNFQKLFPKGSVLVFSLLILSIMLVTSLTILSSAVLDRKASLSTGSSTRSFQVADSGVEEVLYQVYKGSHATLEDVRSAIDNTNATCAGGVIEFPVAGGTAKVTFYQDETTVYAGPCSGGTATDWRDKVVKIKSEGTAGSTTRAVEVAVAAAGGIGDGQTWQDMTVSRNEDIVYQNSTGKPIMISVMQSASDSHELQVSTDNSVWVFSAKSGTSNSAMTIIIPNGHWYKATGSNVLHWAELR